MPLRCDAFVPDRGNSTGQLSEVCVEDCARIGRPLMVRSIFRWTFLDSRLNNLHEPRSG
jgi:hypothetical protein